jgi:hypothetical protein
MKFLHHLEDKVGLDKMNINNIHVQETFIVVLSDIRKSGIKIS